jgi:hypothetical protein
MSQFGAMAHYRTRRLDGQPFDGVFGERIHVIASPAPSRRRGDTTVHDRYGR